MNSGIRVEWIGIITPMRNRPITKPESFHLNLFSANAAIDATTMVTPTEVNDTITELKKLVPIFPDTHAVA